MSLIISGSVQNEMVMQGSFDFLSTLMKFNSQAFKRCDKVLDCTDKVVCCIYINTLSVFVCMFESAQTK